LKRILRNDPVNTLAGADIVKSGMTMKQLILEQTLNLLADSGYSNVSMNMIAKACGISEPAIYYHFNSKIELFRILVFSVLEKARELIVSAAEKNESLHDTLFIIAQNYLYGLKEFPSFPRAYLALATDPSLKMVIEDLQDEIEDIQVLFMDILSREFLRGTIRTDADLGVACRMFRGRPAFVAVFNGSVDPLRRDQPSVRVTNSLNQMSRRVYKALIVFHNKNLGEIPPSGDHAVSVRDGPFCENIDHLAIVHPGG